MVQTLDRGGKFVHRFFDSFTREVNQKASNKSSQMQFIFYGVNPIWFKKTLDPNKLSESEWVIKLKMVQIRARIKFLRYVFVILFR